MNKWKDEVELQRIKREALHYTNNDEHFDKFDNMRYYWREFLRGRRKKYIGRWVVIDRGDFYGDFESRELADRSFGADPNTSNCPFITLVGYENVCNKFDILVGQEEDTNDVDVLLTGLHRNCPKGYIMLDYHKNEGKKIQSAGFEPKLFRSGDARMFVQLLVKKTEKGDQGVPVTMIVDTGDPVVRLHERVFEALGLEPDRYVYINGHRIPAFQIPVQKKYEGFNVCGSSLIRLLGLHLPSEVNNVCSLMFDGSQTCSKEFREPMYKLV
ncbi:hypothetical protein AKO1_007997 [Acrasis kona]|uniref:Uncharacterized protein n=1 Tax=Acrasis kona TaxID=1008807 RepID=A0AAW2YR86_9EUKA